MENFVFDYSPLLTVLYDRGMNKTELMRELSISSKTMAKIDRKEAMNLNTIAKICAYLDVPIENVVKIQYK